MHKNAKNSIFELFDPFYNIFSFFLGYMDLKMLPRISLLYIYEPKSHPPSSLGLNPQTPQFSPFERAISTNERAEHPKWELELGSRQRPFAEN